MTTFFSYKALVSQRSSGYRNTTYALAEIIDNAFDAEAENCRIIFIESRDENGRKFIEEVLISDDGYGMNEAELGACLQFGGGVNRDIDEIVKEKKKGKFGYGLPNASLSQCPCVHVFSQQNNQEFNSVYLDLDLLATKESIEIPQVKRTSLPPYYEKVGAVIDPTKGGVIVSWRRCDRLTNSRASTIVEKSEELLGMLFRYIIVEGKQIELMVYEHNSRNGSYAKTLERVIRPNDPLFLQKNTVIAKELFKLSKTGVGVGDQATIIASHYSKFSQGENKCEPTNIKVEDQCYVYKFQWRGRTYKFPITTSVANLNIQKPGIREGGSTKVGAFYAKKDSICFVRSEREIASGRFGDFYKATEARNRWWTIEVKFDADADDLLGVHNNKQGIEFTYTKDFDPSEEWNPHLATLQQARDKLWYDLTNKIVLAKKEAWKIILTQHREWDTSNTGPNGDENNRPIPEATSRVQKVSETVDGKRKNQFSTEEREALATRLTEKYSALSEEEILASVDRFDRQMSRGCVLYHSSESDALWTLTAVYDFLIVLINTQHEFYKCVIAPFRKAQAEGALAAIELFISSLALEEKEHFSQDEYKDTIELFRSYVGLHLNRYLKELDLSEDEIIMNNESSSQIVKGKDIS